MPLVISIVLFFIVPKNRLRVAYEINDYQQYAKIYLKLMRFTSLQERDIHQFWIPDVYFPNEKAGRLHEISIPNRSIRIYRNGTVRYFSR